MNVVQPQMIIFGGTFDPPHDGHVQCVKSALKRFPKSRIVVMPAAVAPLREEKTKNQYPFEERLTLCQDKFSQLDTQRIAVSDFERTQPQPNYTYNTLQAWQKIYPEQEVAFLMGLDQFKNLDRWKDYQKLLRQFLLIVARRHEIIEENIQSHTYQQWIENFIVKCGLKISEIKGLIYLNDVNSPESSSEIRKNFLKEHK